MIIENKMDNLNINVKKKVLVIGGGMAGVKVAYDLKKNGIEV